MEVSQEVTAPFPHFWWTTSAGERRFARHEHPETTPTKATLFWAHGMNGHMGSPTQNRVFQEATKLGFEVYSFDQCGHGRSATDATRGHLASWLTLVQDQLDFFLHVLHTNPAARTRTFFVGGSSMGGLVMTHVAHHLFTLASIGEDAPDATLMSVPPSSPALDAAKRRTLAAWTRAHFGGAVLAAPAFEPIAQPNAVLHGLLNLLHLLGASSLALGPSPRVEQFVSPESFAAYKSDKYSYSGPMRLSLAHNVLALAQASRELVPAVAFPFLVFQGGRDLSVSVSGAERLVRESRTPAHDKRLVLLDEASHGLFEDPKAAALFPALAEWTSERIKVLKERTVTDTRDADKKVDADKVIVHSEPTATVSAHASQSDAEASNAH